MIGLPRLRYALAVVLAVALTDATHSHHLRQRPVGDDYSWVGPTVWMGGWLLAAIVAYARRLRFAWAYVLFGWIGGPLALFLAAVVKPEGLPEIPATAEADSNVSKWLVAIEQGNLPAIKPVGIMPQPDETYFYEQAAQYGQTSHQRITRGANPALYVPLGHGFRARVGSYRGASQNVSNFLWGPLGTVFVSNLRIVFKANGLPDVAVAPYNKILSYELYPNGLGLQVEGVGTMQFRTGDVILGKLFQKVVDERSQRASTPSPRPEN